MANTYTTSWNFVNDGDTTTIDPRNLVGENNVNILSANIQWKGSETSSSSTSTNYSTNKNTVTAEATSSTSTNTSSNSNSDSATAYRDYTTVTSQKKETLDESTISINYPSKISGETFESHTLTVNASTSSGEVVAYYNDVNGTNQSKTVTSSDSLSYSASTTSNHEGGSRSASLGTIQSGESAGIDIQGETTSSEVISRTAEAQAPSTPSGYSFDRIEVRYYSNGSLSSSDTYYDSAKVGQYFSDTSSNTSNTVKVEAETFGTDSTATTNSDTSCTSYPSVPSGYTFDRHYWREEKNGSYVNSDYIYSNSVGDSRCVTSDSTSNTWDLEMETRGSDTTTTTTYYDTEDPSVSNDISASSTEHLGDTQTSNWYTLSGLAPGSNSINHSMGGSNEGYYKIEFTWDLSVPTSVSTYSVEINGTSYNVALADPNDGALSFNFYRTQVDGDGVLAYDVVDPGDPDALPIYVYHPTHGKLALREKK